MKSAKTINKAIFAQLNNQLSISLIMAKAPIDLVIAPVSKSIHQGYTSRIVLFVCVIALLLWVSSPLGKAYYHVWATSISIGLHGSTFDHPAYIWINDGLPAIFFFVIGLELKRGLMAGELSRLKKAVLPMVAALGGMGLLSLSSKHIPFSGKVFLSALAVANGLGAVIVIAFYYTAHIDLEYLSIAAGLLLLLVDGDLVGIHTTRYSLLLGIAVWACFLFSGMHATIASVLVAFTIPARSKTDEKYGVRRISTQAHKFEEMHPGSDFFSALVKLGSFGVLIGLVAGKLAGVFGSVWIMLRSGMADLPRGVSWKHMSGVALPAGVGFTVSLFVTNLAFADELSIDAAKYGILLASIISGTAGIIYLRISSIPLTN